MLGINQVITVKSEKLLPATFKTVSRTVKERQSVKEGEIFRVRLSAKLCFGETECFIV